MMGLLPHSSLKVLLKEGLRSDRFWTGNLAYSDIMKRIPFGADVTALNESQYWPREQLDAYAWSRIQSLIRDTRHIPLWREAYERLRIDPFSISPREFEQLPIVSKKDFPHDDISRWTDASQFPRSYTDLTSGSTGEPFKFYVDRSFELRSFAICERMMRVAAGGTRPPVVSLRGRPKLGLAFLNQHLFFLQNSNGIKYRLPALVELVRSFDGDVMLYCFPSFYIELARIAKETGQNFSVRAALSTGEAIRASDRALVETHLNTKFYTCYATRELGWLAFECEEHTLHINEEWAYMEIVDDQDRPLPHGQEGKIVTTVFDNRVMPFIRYYNGDRGSISDEPCACGRTLRTLRVGGRHIEYIRFEDGRVVSALDLSSVFDAFSDHVRKYQVIQIAPLSFSIKVIAEPSFCDVQSTIELRLVQTLHPLASISWELVDEIPAAQSGKAVSFVPLAHSHHV